MLLYCNVSISMATWSAITSSRLDDSVQWCRDETFSPQGEFKVIEQRSTCRVCNWWSEGWLSKLLRVSMVESKITDFLKKKGRSWKRCIRNMGSKASEFTENLSQIEAHQRRIRSTAMIPKLETNLGHEENNNTHPLLEARVVHR